MVQGAQTADRALELLALAAKHPDPLTLAEMSALTGLNKATTYRLVQSLVKSDMLKRETDGRRYVIGSGLIAVSAMVMQRIDLRTSGQPALERLAAHTSETVSLHMRHLRQRICIATVESTLPLRRAVPLGETLPLYAGTTGKAILAFLPDREVADILEWAASEGHDPKPIQHQLQHVREHGYLALVGDRNVGVGGMSVPVFAAGGIAGAITVSGPGVRFTAETMEQTAPFLIKTAGELATTLGHLGPIPAGPAAASG